MDEDTATRFVSSLVKSIQALCNGYIDFSSSIEVVGHIHLNIDRNKKLDYVLTEEVSKSVSEGATVFASHSYHSHPPPSASSKTSGDASNQNRRKSQVSRDNDPLSITSLPPEVPNTSRSHSSSRVEENSDSSGSANYSQDFTPVKSENNRTSCQVQESLDRRRKGVPLSHTHRTQSPAAKRPRNHDTSSAVQNPGFDVIEIKEEPDDEPSVYFGDNSSSNMGAGQADIQTPDFSNVVMESLDRVGQIEGTQLVAGGDSGQQHQPFPVMLHTNPGMPSSSSQGPGPSLNPQSTASTSGDHAAQTATRTPTAKHKSSQHATATTSTTPNLTAAGSSATPLNVPILPYPVPTRTAPTLTIPPIQPKLKPEDLPPDSKPEDIARLTEFHVLERVPPTEKKKYPSKRCKVCLSRSGYTPGPTRKHPKESVYYCPQCPSKPGLCCYPCYYVYHSKIHFWEPDEEWDVRMEGGDGGGEGGGVGGGEYMQRGGSFSTSGHLGGGSGGNEYVGSGGGSDGGSLQISSVISTAHSFLGGGMGGESFGPSGSSGRAGNMQVDGRSYAGSTVDVDADRPEQKFCPVPIYGESVYGPGGL
ncbi:streptococcal hemagglutinin-like isoform X3 [Littorina saxatilis]|uniref:streptococcal hemagglutinin-like isoform X3 n=1 Tax=Littorina saxatilis TaxID=31220 RepID=UPI0038B65020